MSGDFDLVPFRLLDSEGLEVEALNLGPDGGALFHTSSTATAVLAPAASVNVNETLLNVLLITS